MSIQNYFLSVLFYVTPFLVAAQGSNYHFGVKINGAGKGKQAMILLPGFACSGDV